MSLAIITEYIQHQQHLAVNSQIQKWRQQNEAPNDY
jgi:hypothetical protein